MACEGAVGPGITGVVGLRVCDLVHGTQNHNPTWTKQGTDVRFGAEGTQSICQPGLLWLQAAVTIELGETQ